MYSIDEEKNQVMGLLLLLIIIIIVIIIIIIIIVITHRISGRKWMDG